MSLSFPNVLLTVGQITCLQTALLLLKQYFNASDIKYSFLEDLESISWVSWNKNTCTFSSCCAPLFQATININGIIFDISISSTGHKILNSLNFWQNLKLLARAFIATELFDIGLSHGLDILLDVFVSQFLKKLVVFWIEFTNILFVFKFPINITYIC